MIKYKFKNTKKIKFENKLENFCYKNKKKDVINKTSNTYKIIFFKSKKFKNNIT
jgi:hypothetical protein